MNSIRIGGAALNQVPIAWQHNKDNILAAIGEARAQGVDILCLPELCITGYGCEDLFLSDWVPERALEILLEIIPECVDITVALGLPVRYGTALYNCAALIDRGELLGFAAKQNLANDGVHYEPRWFDAWPAGVKGAINLHKDSYPVGDLIFDLKGFRIGFEICEDAWRTDRPAYRLNAQGVNLILNPSASHFAFGKSRLREEVIVEGSARFHCYYVYANLLGNESGRMIFDGEIMIAGFGNLLACNPRFSHREYNLLCTDIDPQSDGNDLKGIRLPEEDKNLVFVQAESLALYDYLRKSRNRGFVLSLSGGADSSTCAVLVAEMVRRALADLGLGQLLQRLGLTELEERLSRENEAERTRKLTGELLCCAYQGTVHSSEATFNSARELAAELGATFYHWTIDGEVAGYREKIETAIGRSLTWEQDDITLQNIQSRARSPIIWMLANLRQALLLVTSNRSEGDVGYATMDGDTSGSIAPVAAVDKHFLLQWLRWARQHLGYHSLAHVNSLTPTAELRPAGRNQTDEDDLMPYSVLAAIERYAIRDRKSPSQVARLLIADGIEPEGLVRRHVVKFFRLWSRNQWKRERTAPSFHLDDFNIDPKTWCRFPILSGGFEEELSMLEQAGGAVPDK
jgi:NAD+ synthase (glutamine-hydrolysing)